MTAAIVPNKNICTVVLFSPAIVLMIWAIAVAADNGFLTKGAMVVFLILLAASVVAAEVVRIQVRRHLRRERNSDRHGIG